MSVSEYHFLVTCVLHTVILYMHWYWDSIHVVLLQNTGSWRTKIFCLHWQGKTHWTCTTWWIVLRFSNIYIWMIKTFCFSCTIVELTRSFITTQDKKNDVPLLYIHIKVVNVMGEVLLVYSPVLWEWRECVRVCGLARSEDVYIVARLLKTDIFCALTDSDEFISTDTMYHFTNMLAELFSFTK
jgi:hypothetical protein